MNHREKEDLFIEKFSHLFQAYTMFPPVAGRIFGYLLICDPPYKTASQMVERLSIAKSTVSTIMRPMMQLGFMEEFTLPGERSRMYRIRETGWEELFLKKMSGLSEIRALLDEGREILKEKPRALSKRIDEMHAMYAFFEREIPPLVERWNKEKHAGITLERKESHIPDKEDDLL